MQGQRQTGTLMERNPLKTPMVDSWLAYMYAPILPYLEKIRISREGSRGHKP